MPEDTRIALETGSDPAKETKINKQSNVIM